MDHTSAIRKIIHFVYDLLDDELKNVVAVAGEQFDEIYDMFEEIKTQINPLEATVNGSLTDYERFYQCIPESGDTLAVRRNRIVAKIRARGGLNRLYFENIAEALGYTVGADIVITEGDFAAFKADYGRADIDKVYDQGAGASQYTVVVTGDGVESDTVLQYRFDKQRCCGIEFSYVNT